MNTKIKIWVGIVIIIIIAITVGAFVWIYEKNQSDIQDPFKKQDTGQSVNIGMANPASVHCANSGGTLEIRTGADGGQIGYCKFSDGSECEEWQYFRGECKAGGSQSYIEVKELGFKIPVDASVAGDITYKIMPGGDGYSSAAFSSKSLNALSAGCADGTAVISKINGTPQKNATGESQFYLGRMADIKQFDGYFLLFAGPQDSCSAGKHADLESKVVQIVSDGFRGISLIDKNDTISGWQTYRNEEYGFELTLPKGWENFKTMVHSDPENISVKFIHILLPTTNPDKNWPGAYNPQTKETMTGYASMFSISVMTLDAWNKQIIECEKDEILFCPSEINVIAKNDKYAFDIFFGQDLPRDLESKLVQVMADPKNSTAYFKNNFTLIK